MAQKLTLQPVLVDTASRDIEGRLVLADQKLVAVLVRLDGEEHGSLRGSWLLEAAFGPCTAPGLPSTFTSLDEAERFIGKQLGA